MRSEAAMAAATKVFTFVVLIQLVYYKVKLNNWTGRRTMDNKCISHPWSSAVVGDDLCLLNGFVLYIYVLENGMEIAKKKRWNSIFLISSQLEFILLLSIVIFPFYLSPVMHIYKIAHYSLHYMHYILFPILFCLSWESSYCQLLHDGATNKKFYNCELCCLV